MLFYDPVERVVATLHPDASYDKVTLRPLAAGHLGHRRHRAARPARRPGRGGLHGQVPRRAQRAARRLGNRNDRRIRGALGPADQRAAEQAALYASTPTRAWLDTLGRTFLTVAHNRVPDHGRLADQYCRTHSLLDIQGNEHEVCDALGRAVMRYGYAMLGGQLTHAGMDTGGGELLPDVTGKPVRSWDSRGFAFRTDYDALRRPVRTYVAGPGITGQALQARNEYGESLPGAEARNLRTRVARQYDGAGVTTNEAYDFKGNLLAADRQLAAEYINDRHGRQKSVWTTTRIPVAPASTR